MTERELIVIGIAVVISTGLLVYQQIRFAGELFDEIVRYRLRHGR